MVLKWRVFDMTSRIQYFRLALFLWIIFLNFVLQIFHIEFAWAVFMSNIMLFTMSGDMKNNLVSIEVGGFVGIIFAFLSILAISTLTPAIGHIPAVMLALAIVLYLIIVLGPKCHVALNNSSFAHFTCAFINAELFATHINEVVVIYMIGSLTVNCLSIWMLNYFTKE